MANIKVMDSENISIDQASLGLATPSRLVVTEQNAASDYAGTLAIDDLLVVQLNAGGSPRTVFKGFIYKSDHSLSGNSDAVTHSAIGVEDVIEGAPWEAQIKSYNLDEDVCDDSQVTGATIGEALTIENTGLVANWFNFIIVPASVASLIAGPVQSYQKGFFTWLTELLKPYPYLAWRIDYTYSDPAPVYPIGALVIVDMATPGVSHTLSVGDKIVDLRLAQDTSKSAENLRVWGRGQFEEIYEVIQPAWETEFVSFGPEKLLLPPLDRPEEPSHVYLDHDFIDNLDIKFQTHPNPDGVTLPIQAWAGSDYTVDKEHGRINWNPQNYWINDATGDIQYTVNSPGGGWRRPVAYNNNHVREVASATMSYDFMHPDAFRKYRTSVPLATFRLFNKTIPDPENPGTTVDVPLEADEFVNAYKPIFNPTGVYDSDPPADGFWKEPEARPGSVAEYVGHNVDTFDPATYTIMSDFVLRPIVKDGTTCVYFAKRQLLPINAIFKHPDAPNLRLVSWDIVLHYTKWLDLLETRGGNLGKEKYANYVYDNVYSYTDVHGTTLVDLSAFLTDLATNLQAYLSIAQVTGSMTYSLDITSGQWDLPFAVGDRVLLDGEVTPGGVFDTTPLLINKIDFSRVDSGLVTLGFGNFEPRESAFIARANLPTDLLNTSTERLDVNSLRGA